MKRELKVNFSGLLPLALISFRRCPDEEGTESEALTPPCGISIVSEGVPMKRELKEWTPKTESLSTCSFRRCPDEEGTESASSRIWAIAALHVSEGVPMKRELKDTWRSLGLPEKTSFRRCPDEEGTERFCHPGSGRTFH